MKHYDPRICARCERHYAPSGPRQKYCSECERIVTKETMHNNHKKRYVRKGYNQTGTANNNWKGGEGIYRRLKPVEKCERCGSTEHLLVHHRDGNRRNNAPENLEGLCKRCHQIHHDCQDHLPKDRVWTDSDREDARKRTQARERDSLGRLRPRKV